MPDTPTPAVRAAREAERRAKEDVSMAIIAYADAFADGDRNALGKAKEVIGVLDTLVDAVTARATAELLASGTPLWVGRDPAGIFGAEVFLTDPTDTAWGEGYHLPDADASIGYLKPGTVRQAALVLRSDAP